MKHIIEFNDASARTFTDDAIKSHDVQLTPLGVRIIAQHKLSADQNVSMLFPWQAIRLYSMVGNPANMVRSQENGS